MYTRNWFSPLLFTAFLCSLLFTTACEKDERAINQNVTEVPSLTGPADNAAIKLRPAANLFVTFQWNQARAEDGGLVLYEVAFDQVGGDFSKPFFTIVSDNKGVDNKLTISHGDLNKIATQGGAAFFEKKKFRWTVLSSKGTTVKKALEARVIELERPGGFATLPPNLFITGTATEGGATLASALKMRTVSPGIFEIFTRLSAGTYQFVDATTGTPNRYFTFLDQGINSIGVNGSNTVTGPAKVYRIILDFNNINAKQSEVISLQYWYSQAGAFKFTLPYVSNGEWRYNGFVCDWIPVGWSPGGEQRYKYKMVLNDGTGNQDLWLNSTFSDPPNQDVYPSTPAYRTVDVERNNSSGFDYSWKMVMTEVPIGSTADFWVTLRGSDPFYTQNYKRQ